jgi:predicted amidohydrolase YtcJ
MAGIMWAACAEFTERQKGSITTGKLADLVLLSGDPFTTEPAALRDLRVDLTTSGGRVVFERKQRSDPGK